MPKAAADAAYLARLRDYYARWRSVPAYGPLQGVLGLASRSAVAKVLHRLRAAGFLARTPDGRWTPTARFFARPLADAAVPAGLPAAMADGGKVDSIDAWLVRHPSRTVLVPVTGVSYHMLCVNGRKGKKNEVQQSTTYNATKAKVTHGFATTK